MKDGVINTEAKNLAVEASFRTLTAWQPWLAIWPISVFVRAALDKLISKPTDELQRYVNYEGDRRAADIEGTQAQEASGELQRHQDEGRDLDDAETRAAYERHKKESREVVRIGGPLDPRKSPK